MVLLELAIIDHEEALFPQERMNRPRQSGTDSDLQCCGGGVIGILDQLLQNQEFVCLPSIEKNTLNEFYAVCNEFRHELSPWITVI